MQLTKSLLGDLSRKARSVMECFLLFTSHTCYSMPAYTGHPVPAYTSQEGLSSMHGGQNKQSYGNRQQDDAKHFEWRDHSSFQERFSSII